MNINYVIFLGTYGHTCEIVIGSDNKVTEYAKSELSRYGYRDFLVEKPVKNSSSMLITDENVNMKLIVLS